MRRRLILGALAAVVAFAVAPTVWAHDDPNRDDPEDPTVPATRCDKWYRQSHESGTGNRKSSHHDTSNSDINPEATVRQFVPSFDDPANNYIHSHGGHHLFRNRYGYIEVVGGQAYRGPDPAGNDFPGQGGYVQGEVDVVEGGPDVEFNVAYFGPDVDNPPAASPTAIQNWVNGQYGRVCVDTAGQRVERQTRNP